MTEVKDCETCQYDAVPARDAPCVTCTRIVDGKFLPKPTNYTPRRMSIDDCTPQEWNDAARNAWEAPKDVDPVNRPPHYTAGAIECIEYIEDVLTREEYIGYLRGQVIKYQHRLMTKGNPAQDAGKLAWYADRLRGVLEQ
jgi:hypothetical protein